MPWERRIATLEDIRAIEQTPLDDRITETSTYELVTKATARDPNGIAVSFQLKGDPKSKTYDWSFKRFEEEVTRAANLFHSLGVKDTASVALLLPNLPETLAALFAGQTASIVNPINPLLEPEKICAYFHTGGTTGDPKLAQHTVGGILYQSHAVNDGVFGEKDTILCALPLFHCFGAYVMGTAAALNGGRLVLMTPAGFRGEGVIDNFWKLVEKYKVNFFMAVPTALAALNQREIDGDVSTLNFCVCGSAPLPVELFKQFESKTGIRILEGFGQTEATVVCSVNPPDGERKIGSVGYPLPYTQMEAMIVDGDGKFVRLCEADEIGELCIAGPHVFPGYKEADKNDGVFLTDEAGKQWLRSGDLGRRDGDDYFWITGRAKDLIIRGGHNIDPGMIEEALFTHPSIAFAGAIGQPDAYAGEVPCAYVELNDGMTATPEELLAHAAEHVQERAAKPVYVEVMDELPKTAVGKTFKPDLRKSAIRRVLVGALSEKDIDAAITVENDKLKGMVAVVEPQGGKTRTDIAPVLDRFAVAWRMKD